MGGSTTDATAHRASVADEAAEWLATLTDAASTAQERQTFVSWLRRSNLHVEEFLRISALARHLTRSRLLPPEDIAELIRHATTDSASAAQVANISQTNRAGTAPGEGATPRLVAPRWRPALAACVVAVTILALLIFRFDPSGWLAPTYTTSVGELRSITLEDGSVVELNTQSRLRTHFTATERRVELVRGEAMFKVAKSPGRPFGVATGSTDIVAVGTAFNVYQQSSRTIVTVLEGRVRVTDHRVSDHAEGAVASPLPVHRTREFELARGEQAIIAPHTPIARTSVPDPAQVTSWTERRLIFDETPLAAAASEFARYNDSSIRIEDPKLGQLHITGVFDATDPASLVQFVQTYRGIRVQRDRSGWVLESAEATRGKE